MTPAPVSAFEAYQEMKKKKKSSSMKKKTKKNMDLKKNPLLVKELHQVTSKNTSPKQHTNFTLISKQDKKNALRTNGQFNLTSKPSNSIKKIPKIVTNEKKGFSENPVHSKPLKKSNEKKPPNESRGCLLSPANDCNSTDRISNEHSSSSGGKKNKKSKVSQPPISKSAQGHREMLNKDKQVHQKVSIVDSLNSIDAANHGFSWMVSPIKKQSFFSQYWEKRPVHISREWNRDYYSTLLSSSTIDTILRSNNLLFGKNVDVTSYTDGERKTLNPVGRAQAGVVWDFYRNGCSVRLLNPQTYIPELWEFNSTLQELFGSFVGSNVYLTPPNSQGFAPHYDDIEAFVLQVEGCKSWRVYAPRHDSEKLPRTSSCNFTQEEIGEPILDVLLKEGDMLYFPRGFIHQANTVPGQHSLHITVSTYQRNSWADLLEKLVPAALANAIEEDEEFREGMPLDVLDHLGAIHSDSDSPQRQHLLSKIQTLFSKLIEHAPIDAAADQIGKEFQHDALPPCLTSAEKKCSILDNSEKIGKNGRLSGTVHLTSETCIRLTRSKVLRLVSEEDPDTLKLYHCIDNSLEYHGGDPQFIEIPVSMGPAIEYLINSYPEFVSIHALPLEETQEKIQVAVELWERGLVLTQSPLPFLPEVDV